MLARLEKQSGASALGCPNMLRDGMAPRLSWGGRRKPIGRGQSQPVRPLKKIIRKISVSEARTAADVAALKAGTPFGEG
ncbi:MAG: hypothetical protein LBQ12_08635, partial [Deltaproteobacteria bacterium]|nr:hypothetical protein [Deltaproteobacteria bacterium]